MYDWDLDYLPPLMSLVYVVAVAVCFEKNKALSRGWCTPLTRISAIMILVASFYGRAATLTASFPWTTPPSWFQCGAVDLNISLSHPPTPVRVLPSGANGRGSTITTCGTVVVHHCCAFYLLLCCSSAMLRRDAANSGARMDAWRSEFWRPHSPASRQTQTTTLTCVLASHAVALIYSTAQRGTIS